MAQVDERQSQLLALRALDGRILEIGDRLAIASADICPDTAPVPGFAVHDLAQYGTGYREVATDAFGLGKGPAVLAIDSASAAAGAGLRVDDVLIAADGVAFAAQSASGRKGSFDGVEAVMDQLEAAFADGKAELELDRAGQRMRITVTPAAGCRGRFQLVPGGRLNAGADGRYIQISSALTVYAQSDDELAAILAHELAHNILRHRVRLDEARVSRGVFKSFGRNARLIRETEVEADRLSVYLLDRAGYSIAAAANFWRRFGPEHGHGIFASPTHPGWKQRVATIEQEAAVLAQLKQGNPRPVPPLFQAPAG